MFAQTVDATAAVNRIVRVGRDATADEADSDAAAEWLAERGFQQGGKYVYDRCPIEPAHTSGGSESVSIPDGGIFCHSRAGRERCFPGVRKAGFVPWPKLLGGICDERPAGLLRAAVRGMTHWEHARHV